VSPLWRESRSLGRSPLPDLGWVTNIIGLHAGDALLPGWETARSSTCPKQERDTPARIPSGAEGGAGRASTNPERPRWTNRPAWAGGLYEGWTPHAGERTMHSWLTSRLRASIIWSVVRITEIAFIA